LGSNDDDKMPVGNAADKGYARETAEYMHCMAGEARQKCSIASWASATRLDAAARAAKRS
jgi:hypothetical protein